MKTIFLIALIAVAFLVALVEGFHNPFTLWNFAPLVAAFIVLLYTERKPRPDSANRPKMLAGYGFVLGVVIVEIGAHVAWMFDWGKTASGSSTAGLLFVVLPFLALLAGLSSAMAGALIGRWGGGRSTRSEQ